MKRTKRTVLLVLYALALVLVVTLPFTDGIAEIWARYFSQAQGTGTADISLFVVGGDLDRSALSIGAEDSPSFTLGGSSDRKTAALPFYITSRSEVSVGYSVEVNFGKALPSYLTVTLSDGTNTQTLSCDGAKSVFTFEDFGSVAAFAGGETDPDTRVNFTLTVTVTNSDLILDEFHLTTAKLTVTVDQLD